MNQLKVLFTLLFNLAGLIAFAQENQGLQKAKALLDSGATMSSILSDARFDSIKSETGFRELIREHAVTQKIQLVATNEPGEKISVKVKLLHADAIPWKHILVYVYQTDHRGWYGKDRPHFSGMEGDRKHARLFAYLRTDHSGSIEFETIQPHGYPQSDLPAHIHFEVFDSQGKAIKITELLFDDDERMKGTVRTRSESEGFFIGKAVHQGKEKIYNYTINTGN